MKFDRKWKQFLFEEQISSILQDNPPESQFTNALEEMKHVLEQNNVSMSVPDIVKFLSSGVNQMDPKRAQRIAQFLVAALEEQDEESEQLNENVEKQ